MAAPNVTGTEIQADVPESGGAFPPFEPTHFASQIVWLAIVFGALYLLMARVALPRIGSILEARGKRIESDLREASDMQRQAETASAAQEKTIADARANAQGVAQSTRDKLTAEADVRRKAIEADLAVKMAAAEAQIASTKTGAMANVETIARDAAAAIVEHLTGKPADPAAVAAAVTAAAQRA